MQRARASRQKRDGYQLLGRPTTMLDVELDPNSANKLRNFIAQDFLPKMMSITPVVPSDKPQKQIVRKLTENEDKVLFKYRLRNDSFVNPDPDFVYLTGFTLLHNPDGWQLHTLLTKDAVGLIPDKLATRHMLNMYHGRLFEAKKEVRVIRSNSEEVLSYAAQSFRKEVDPDSPPMELLAFERPLREDDVTSLEDHLRQVAKRCLATA